MDESIANLEEVVRERNRAYYDLEVGDWRGEQPCCNLIDAHIFFPYSPLLLNFLRVGTARTQQNLALPKSEG